MLERRMKTVYHVFPQKQNLVPSEGISSINSFFNCGISLDLESWEEFPAWRGAVQDHSCKYAH